MSSPRDFQINEDSFTKWKDQLSLAVKGLKPITLDNNVLQDLSKSINLIAHNDSFWGALTAEQQKEAMELLNKLQKILIHKVALSKNMDDENSPLGRLLTQLNETIENRKNGVKTTLRKSHSVITDKKQHPEDINAKLTRLHEITSNEEREEIYEEYFEDLYKKKTINKVLDFVQKDYSKMNVEQRFRFLIELGTWLKDKNFISQYPSNYFLYSLDEIFRTDQSLKDKDLFSVFIQAYQSQGMPTAQDKLNLINFSSRQLKGELLLAAYHITHNKLPAAIRILDNYKDNLEVKTFIDNILPENKLASDAYRQEAFNKAVRFLFPTEVEKHEDTLYENFTKRNEMPKEENDKRLLGGRLLYDAVITKNQERYDVARNVLSNLKGSSSYQEMSSFLDKNEFKFPTFFKVVNKLRFKWFTWSQRQKSNEDLLLLTASSVLLNDWKTAKACLLMLKINEKAKPRDDKENFAFLTLSWLVTQFYSASPFTIIACNYAERALRGEDLTILKNEWKKEANFYLLPEKKSPEKNFPSEIKRYALFYNPLLDINVVPEKKIEHKKKTVPPSPGVNKKAFGG